MGREREEGTEGTNKEMECIGKDDALEKALKYDAIDDAELMTGKPKEDLLTGYVGMGNLIEGNMIKEKILKDRKDSFFSMPFEEYLNLVNRLCFDKIFEMLYSCDCCGKISKEVMQVYWRNGFLLIVESFMNHVNSATLIFNWKPNVANKWPEVMSSGGFAQEDRTVYAGHNDVREGLRYTIRRLEETGTILKQWINQSWIWLCNAGDKKPYTKDDEINGELKRNYEEINKERLDQFPEEIQKAILYK